MDDIPKLKRIFHKAFTLLASYQMKDCNCYKSIERSIPVRFANLNSWFKWNPYPYFPLQYTHTHTHVPAGKQFCHQSIGPLVKAANNGFCQTGGLVAR